MKQSVMAAIVVSLAVFGSAWADDWPQWMGPQRDDVWRKTGIVEKFPKDGLKVKWRATVSLGFAGPAVAKGRVYVADYVLKDGDVAPDPNRRNKLQGKERLQCLDAKDGKLLWKYDYEREYNLSYPNGPRATPTVVAGKVYWLGAEGDLTCLDAEKGTVIWTKQLRDEYKAATPIWGFVSAPLVDDKNLYVMVGGKGSQVVALDRDTGKEVWRSLDGKDPGYCPPSFIEIEGVKQLIVWEPEAIHALDPKDGKEIWSVELKPAYGMSIMAPRLSGNHLYTGGIGEQAVLLKLTKTKAEVVWRGKKDTAVYPVNMTPLIEDGHIYGVCTRGELRCVELGTGKRLWDTYKPTTGERFANSGTAFLVKNGDRYFLMNEKGELILAKLSPKGYEEISRAKLLEPTMSSFGREVVWSHPAFAEKCLFARNDKELICVPLAKE